MTEDARPAPQVVLGLDAAWTRHHASGAGIIAGYRGKWRCLAAAHSVEALEAQAGRRGIVEAAEAIARVPVTLISVDMPLATTPIASRRSCDNQLSRAFGRQGCGVHSPSPDRPGDVSTELMAAFGARGFELAGHGSTARERQVIEVYPHIAVMRLLGADYRVPYKIARARQYWPEAKPEERRQNILSNLARILHSLEERISGIPLELPPAGAGPREIKRFEDALDGVVCAWIGARYLEGQCQSFGDETAAIWVPLDE